ncbi:MAG: methyltransferase domain-containing protein [Planctomycetota bacterium]|nr:MAG: methyltransferase domain-containing protein [Planctomycetota bacterium]
MSRVKSPKPDHRLPTARRESPAAGEAERVVVMALAIVTLSGAAALMHELLWTRRLVDLLGASAESMTRVFGSFFLGLAIGSAVAGYLLRRLRRPWRAAGVAEIAVALLSLVILTLPAWSDRLWLALGPDGLTSASGASIKLLLSVMLVGAPAFCMGLVLPLVIAALADNRDMQPKRVVWLYAANTFGGVLGLVGVTWFVLPWLRADGAILLACSLNLLAGVCLLAIDRRATDRHVSTSRPSEAALPQRKLMFVAAWSGFGLLAFEVAAAQLVMLFAPLSYYAPAVILGTVLLMLASASAWVAARGASQAVAPTVLAAGAALVLTPPLFQVAVQMFSPEPAATLAGFTLRMLGFALVVLGPAFFVGGLIFPRLLSLASVKGQVRVDTIAWLIAINGVGGFLGAEVMNRYLLPSLGIFVACGALALAYVLVAAVLFALEDHPQRGGLAAIAVAVAALIGFFTQAWFASLPHYNPNLGFEVVAEIFGRDGPIAVVQNRQLGRAILLSNQYILGGTNARADQERQAHMALALHPEPRDVAFIGVATGITPGAATLHSDMNVTAVELSEQVVTAAREHFHRENHDLARSRVRIVVEDGRTYLAACAGKFDVVIGDLFLPWAPGEGRLFSLEHYAGVRRALKPNGLFCQWLPMYQLTPEQFDLIARTFRSVFPDAQLFRGTLGWQQPTIALVGWNEGGLDWSVVESRCDEIRSADVVQDPVVRSASGMAMMYVGALSVAEHGPVNTLGNVALELSASRERITGDPGKKYFYGSRWLSFLEGAESGRQQLPPFVREMRAVGLEISKWEFAAQRPDFPGLEEQRGRILSRLPEQLLQGSKQSRTFWPGNSELLNSSPGL